MHIKYPIEKEPTQWKKIGKAFLTVAQVIGASMVIYALIVMGLSFGGY